MIFRGAIFVLKVMMALFVFFPSLFKIVVKPIMLLFSKL